jgi:hypothetical protein
METEKISQNIQTLIGDIGEKMSLFNLYKLINKNKDLEIYKNYSESGYDIGIINHKSRKKVRIEVKTRQRLMTTTKKNKNSCQFTLTEIEKNSSDFLVAYWLDYTNDFFIVPIDSSDIKKTKSDEKYLFKFVVSRLKDVRENNIYSQHAMKYLNNWEILLDFLK